MVSRLVADLYFTGSVFDRVVSRTVGGEEFAVRSDCFPQDVGGEGLPQRFQ